MSDDVVCGECGNNSAQAGAEKPVTKKRSGGNGPKTAAKHQRTGGAFTPTLSHLPKGDAVIMSAADAGDIFANAQNPLLVVATTDGHMVATAVTDNQTIVIPFMSPQQISAPVTIHAFSPITSSLAAAAAVPSLAAASDDEEVAASDEDEEMAASEEEAESDCDAGAETQAP